jgi:hypothetical protein
MTGKQPCLVSSSPPQPCSVKQAHSPASSSGKSTSNTSAQVAYILWDPQVCFSLSVSFSKSSKATHKAAHLQGLAQAPVLDMMLSILLLQLLLDPRKVVPVHSPAGLEPLLGLSKFNPLALPAAEGFGSGLQPKGKHCM